MADPAILPWALTGTGAILAVLWRALEGSRTQQIASIGAELKHERQERERERAEAKTELIAARARIDALASQLEKERIQAAGVTVRIRQDKTVSDALADDMPTAVRYRADLMSPKSNPPPRLDPESDRLVRRYARPDLASTPPEPILRPSRDKLPSGKG